MEIRLCNAGHSAPRRRKDLKCLECLRYREEVGKQWERRLKNKLTNAKEDELWAEVQRVWRKEFGL